jgi:PAS domain S-box-containing protein
MHANEGNLLIAELQALLDALPFGIAWMEPNRIIRRCNRAYELLLGFAPGEIIGRPAPLPESERLVWETQESELRAGQRIVNYEGPRLRKDGSQFPALISANPLIRRNGSYIGLIGTILDHTGRHEQEFEMQILALMVHYSPYFMGVAEREGRATFVNPRGQEMFGLDGDEHVKRTNVLDYFAPSQRALAETQLIPALLTQKELTFETLGRNFRTGNEFPLHCTCFVIPDQKTGETKYIAAVAEDITERMQVESKLKIFCSVVQHSPDPIGVAGMDLHTIFINRAGRERFSSMATRTPCGHTCSTTLRKVNIRGSAMNWFPSSSHGVLVPGDPFPKPQDGRTFSGVLDILRHLRRKNGRAVPFRDCRQGHLGKQTYRGRTTPPGCLPEGSAKDQPYRKLDLEAGYGRSHLVGGNVFHSRS